MDKIARRYSMAPSDVLEMSCWDLSVCLICISHADQARAEMVKQARQRTGKSLIPFPVPIIDLGDI